MLLAGPGEVGPTGFLVEGANRLEGDLSGNGMSAGIEHQIGYAPVAVEFDDHEDAFPALDSDSLTHFGAGRLPVTALDDDRYYWGRQKHTSVTDHEQDGGSKNV